MSCVFTHVLAEEERLLLFLLCYHGIKVIQVPPESALVLAAGGTKLNGGPWENKLLLSLPMSHHQWLLHGRRTVGPSWVILS